MHSRHTHNRAHTQAHTSTAPAPPSGSWLPAKHRFLLGVHNLSQALIESRVIYNSAAWAAPSLRRPGESLGPCHSPLTGSHIQVPWKKPFPFFPPDPFFILHFLQKLWLNPATPLPPSNPVSQSPAICRPITAFLTCLARNKQDSDCRILCCLSCCREIGFRPEKGLHRGAGTGVWALVSRGLESPSVEGKATKNLISCLSSFWGTESRL